MKYVKSAIPRLALFFVLMAGAVDALDMPPLSVDWKSAVYPGLIGRLRPRVPRNMKFLFVNEPVPCILRDGIGGYGGFVQMRKKSILWFQQSELYFYLINGNGALCAFRTVDSMNEDSVIAPRMLDVTYSEREVWVEPVTTTRTTTHWITGEEIEETVELVPGYHKTVLDKNVRPILNPNEQIRLNFFRREDFSRLPACQ